jgi:glycosyltransferase involved in cell wall biosynthesis
MTRATDPIPRRRVALVHNIITPARAPFMEALAADPRIDLRVLFMARTEAHRAWRVPDQLGFAHEILPGLHFVLRGGAVTLHLNPSVVPALLRFDPDTIVVGGWDSPTTLLAATARNLGRPRRLVLWAESNGVGKPESEGWKAIPKRWIARRADVALVPGRMAEDYVRRFARASLRVERFPNIIDASRFQLPDAQREEARRAVRAALGLAGTTFLFVGQFIERKGFSELIEGFRRAALPGPATLLLVGDGLLRSAAVEAARSSPANRRIVVEPFRQVEELAGIYASADAFVLPSREDPWPLVVVEAMTAGLPVLASDAVGNAPELIVPGRTGWIFRASDAADLAVWLARAASADLRRLGAEARSLVAEECSIERCVEAFARAVGASE